MKILLALVVLLPPLLQDAHTLAWDPPEGRVAVVKVSWSAQNADGYAALESEAELHPKDKTAEGRAVRIQVNRFTVKAKTMEETRGLDYERGKKAVVSGKASEEEVKMAESLGTDEVATITPHGRFKSELKEPSLALNGVLGVVDIAIPAGPVKPGASWTKDVQVPFPDTDFIGRLTFTLDSVEKGSQAMILVKAAERGGKIEGEEKRTWGGEGRLIFSLKDRVITSFKFTLAQKDGDGKETRSMKQELTVSLKP